MQHAEPFGGDGGEQVALVGKVAVEGRTRDAEASADFAQGQPFDTVGTDGGQRLIQQRAAQVAVVVGAGRLARGAGRSRHATSSYRMVLTSSTLCGIDMLTMATLGGRR